MAPKAIAIAPCVDCKRFFGPKMGSDGPRWFCDAFGPLPVPQEIFTGVNRHKADVAGDNGKHFVPW